MDEKEVIITFDTIFDLCRRERHKAELQKIDARFFDDVVRYFKEKQAIIDAQERKNSVFAATELEKTRNQLREAKRLMREIYTWRETKIVQGAVFQSRCSGKGFDFSTLLPEEVELFNSMHCLLSGYREKILNSLLNHEMPKVCRAGEKSSIDSAPSEEPESPAADAPNFSSPTAPKGLKTTSNTKDGSISVAVKNQLPEFMGPDLKRYGPYKQGENAELPKEVAEMLVKSGNAEIA